MGKGENEPNLSALAAFRETLGVSIDELLTGRPTAMIVEQMRQKPDARVFMAAATACNILGYLLKVLFQSNLSMGIGLSLFIFGIAIYVIGLFVSSKESQNWVRRWFWIVNIWFAAYWPALILDSMSYYFPNYLSKTMTMLYMVIIIAYFVYYFIHYFVTVKEVK